MQVDRRHRRVAADVAAGREPGEGYTDTMRDYWLLLKDGYVSNEAVEYAATTYQSGGIRKAIMDSLLLGEADLTEIETVFDVPVAWSRAYKELFFDTANFKTGLDRLAYMDNMDPNDAASIELAKRTVALGPDFIYFTYGNRIPSTEEQRLLVKKLYMTSAYKAMDSAFNNTTSKVSAAARDYAKLMLKAYETIEDLLNTYPGDGMGFVKVLLKKDMEVSLAARPKGSPKVSAEDII